MTEIYNYTDKRYSVTTTENANYLAETFPAQFLVIGVLPTAAQHAKAAKAADRTRRRHASR